MKRIPFLLAATLLLPACGSGSGNDQFREADASATTTVAPVATSTSASSIADGDRTSVLKALELTPDAKGLVLNECGDRIMPQLLPVDIGKGVGTAVLVVMTGGPSLASCYGDGPGLTLMRQVDGGWKQIYSSRGGFLAIMKDAHNGAQDLVFAGPGLSHPLFTWNGTTYVRAGREMPDERLEGTTILP